MPGSVSASCYEIMEEVAHERLLPARKLEERAWKGQVVCLDHLEVRVAVHGQVVEGLEVIDGEEHWEPERIQTVS